VPCEKESSLQPLTLFTAAHQPRTITHPGITAGANASDPMPFDVSIAFTVSCRHGTPVPLTVKFSDPSGSPRDVLSNPCTGTGRSGVEWWERR
jgi:hypothetical protein